MEVGNSSAWGAEAGKILVGPHSLESVATMGRILSSPSQFNTVDLPSAGSGALRPSSTPIPSPSLLAELWRHHGGRGGGCLADGNNLMQDGRHGEVTQGKGE